MSDPTQIADSASWWERLLLVLGGGTIATIVGHVFRYLTRCREVEATENEAAVEASSETHIAVEREATARQRIGAKEREQERPFIARELDRCHDERKRISTENAILARDVVSLTEENARLLAEKITFLERIDAIEAEVRDCHDGRAREHEAREQERREDRAWKADTERHMRGITEWMQRELEARGARPTTPPQRSVTPVYGTPAVDMVPSPRRVPTHAGDDEP